ncbi:S-layer homology domain-containing protein [Paenibacillus agaridevorans]|uniref:S-layer homology domain-containing protein n=1 Tax=Paenibacillus agaridevorans TaxID=171404 RepID=UPI001BE44697|nr:S-layer homology domain-containing protein [Paenibacillus agaridevorans]
MNKFRAKMAIFLAIILTVNIIQYSGTVVAAPVTLSLSVEDTLTIPAKTEGYSYYDNDNSFSIIKNGPSSEVITGLSIALSGGATTKFNHASLGTTMEAGTSSISVNIRPKPGLQPGTYTETVTVTADGGLSDSFVVTYTVNAAPAPTLSLSVDGTLTIPAKTEGYLLNDNGESFSINKVGYIGGTITGLNLALSGGATTNFVHGTLGTTIGAGTSSVSLIIRPKAGLQPGTYTETVTVTADGGLSDSFVVTYTVNAAPAPTLSLSVDGTLTIPAKTEGYLLNDNGESFSINKVGYIGGTITGLNLAFSGGATTNFVHGTLGTTIGAGTSSVSLIIRPKAGLLPGTYTETVTVTANGGLSDSFIVTYTVNAAPNVSITSTENNPTNNASYTVTVSFSEPVIGFEPTDITVTNGAASNLQTSDNQNFTATITPSSDGAVTVNIEANVAEGMLNNPNKAAEPHTIEYDATAPGAPIITSPADGVYTTNRRPQFNGTAEPNSAIVIKVNDVEHYVTTDSLGAWIWSPETNWSDGAYEISLTAEDEAGNISVATTMRLYVYTQSYVPNTPNTSVIVFVNDEPVSAGTSVTTYINNRSVTTILVDEQKLQARLDEEQQGAVIRIPVGATSNVLIGELNGRMISSLEQKQAVIEFATDHASYRLPAQQINIAAISQQFGQDVQLQDIKIQIEIAYSSEEMGRIVENSAAARNFSIVVPPLDFSVKVLYGDSMVEIGKFVAYIERKITIPDGVDPAKITTAIVIDADGAVRHVPTKVTMENGSYYVLVNSLTNSTYTVIWHPIEFNDVIDHWSREAVNDMGSRMVVEGTGNGLFNPDASITRSEFAAIMVRGLGLKPENETSPFSDIAEGAWYADAVLTAYEYGLIDGYTDGTFRPADLISREQAMTILSRAMTITGLKAKLPSVSIDAALQLFEDVSSASEWAKDGIANTVTAGIITGRSDSMLAPNENITRAEVALIVRRLLKKSELI